MQHTGPYLLRVNAAGHIKMPDISTQANGNLDSSQSLQQRCDQVIPNPNSLLLLIGFTEPQDRSDVVMSHSAAGEIFSQHFSP